jgi:hypothetical protein
VRRWIWLLVLVVVASGTAPELKGQAEAGGSLASAVPPAYPVTAKAAGIEGKVVLTGVVGTDGKMRDLRVIKGPDESMCPRRVSTNYDSCPRWIRCFVHSPVRSPG